MTTSSVCTRTDHRTQRDRVAQHTFWSQHCLSQLLPSCSTRRTSPTYRYTLYSIIKAHSKHYSIDQGLYKANVLVSYRSKPWWVLEVARFSVLNQIQLSFVFERSTTAHQADRTEPYFTMTASGFNSVDDWSVLFDVGDRRSNHRIHAIRNTEQELERKERRHRMWRNEASVPVTKQRLVRSPAMQQPVSICWNGRCVVARGWGDAVKTKITTQKMRRTVRKYMNTDAHEQNLKCPRRHHSPAVRYGSFS